MTCVLHVLRCGNVYYIFKSLQVVFDSYIERRSWRQIQPITFYTGCICGGELVEPYHPDRILRQIGYVQRIPTSHHIPFTGLRGKSASQYTVVYQFTSTQWIEWKSHIVPMEDRQPVLRLYDCTKDYMSWFLKISHVRLCNPADRSCVDVGQTSDSGKLHEERNSLALDRVQTELLKHADGDEEWRTFLTELETILCGDG